jgi:hypothetical protein
MSAAVKAMPEEQEMRIAGEPVELGDDQRRLSNPTLG